jgi:hypothetical protein
VKGAGQQLDRMSSLPRQQTRSQQINAIFDEFTALWNVLFE